MPEPPAGERFDVPPSPSDMARPSAGTPPSAGRASRSFHLAVIAGTAALGGLLFGYDTGVISGALLFLRTAFHLSNLLLGVVTSIALAGAACGAAVAGRLADRFGRRPTLMATALIFVLGAVVSALAPDLVILLAGRLLVGVGIGGASMLTPLYLAEIAPAKARARSSPATSSRSRWASSPPI